MHPARRPCTGLLFAVFVLSACGEPLSPLSAGALGRGANASGAVQEHVEFDVFDNNDLPLTCLNGEMTHWEGSVHVTMDIITAPSGLTQERIQVEFGDDYFVERTNGDRYYPVGPFPVNEHRLFGAVTVIAGTAAGAWKSASGDVIALGFHAQFVYDKDGNAILEQFIGACP
jgi:hypothetical protein